MIDKFKNLSLGKKVSVSLWAFWSLILLILIGLLTGLNKKINDKTVVNGGWSVALKQKKELELLKADVDTFKNNVDWKENYFVKDKKATAEFLKSDKLASLKSNILQDPNITGKLPDNINNKSSLDDIKKAILNLKTTSQLDKKAIEAMYKLIYENTKFKKLSEARMDESFKSNYDLAVGKLDSQLLYPIVASNKIVERGNIIELGTFNKVATDSAKKAQNLVAAFGFVFLTATIATILTTVFVSIKERKGNK